MSSKTNRELLNELVRLRAQVAAMRQLLDVTDSIVIEQTTSLTNAMQELERARDKAVAASKFKSEFLANMSHEVRTPLNGVIGMLELLLRNSLTDEQRDEASIALKSAQSLLNVVNDVLDFSKIEYGRLALETLDFDLTQLVEGTAELVAEEAHKKLLSLITFISPTLPATIQGDPSRLRQILLNLLSNAIKFTDHGEVVVRVTQDQYKQNLLFSVTDTGIGIPPHTLERLFEPFVQADGSVTRRYGGTGLGLSISKSLVELMGGHITIESSPGVGTVCSFSVPLIASDRHGEQPSKKTDLSHVKLLLVIGSESCREMLNAYCSYWGAEIQIAVTAQAGLKSLRQAADSGVPFNLAIIDYSLSDMDACDLAIAIKKEHLLARMPLMMVSSKLDDAITERCLESGYSIVLNRPLRRSHLLDCIGEIVKGRLSRELPERTAEPASEITALRGMVLVAEDNAVNRKVISKQLERLGWKAHCVGSGREAVHAADQMQYSVILMDVQMPEMDGLEATKEIRKKEAMTGLHVPIVAVTAHAKKSDEEMCLSVGMDDYISKPVNIDKLAEVLERWA